MQTITEAFKKEVQATLAVYVKTFKSQRAAAENLNDVSESLLIQIKDGNWSQISEKMWRNVAKQLGIGLRRLKLVETLDFQTIFLICDLAKEEGATFSIIGGAGFGKTATSKQYATMHRSNNVFRLECCEYWQRKDFLSKLMQAMGRESAGMTVVQMMETIVREMRKMHQPLLILDEVDKLTDPVFKFFITLYNELNGLCGFVWLSTSNIEKRMNKGLSINRNGYQELFSRIGSKYVRLHGSSSKEIERICKENDINDPEEISTIINECKGDLRRVERSFLKHKQRKLKAA